MTRVDFYILKSGDAVQRQQFACRLADQLFRRGHRLYLHTADESTAVQLDELLWGYRPGSFVPHGLLGSEDGGQVAIGWGEDPGEQHDTMINLALAVPAFVGRFERVAEVVAAATPEITRPLRESFRYYRDRGYPIENHEL